MDTVKGGLWDRLAGNWKQFSGEVRKQWADLTDDDLEYIIGAVIAFFIIIVGYAYHVGF